MGEMATRRGRYPAEVRERAVRLVFEHQGEHATQWAAIVSIAEKFGTSAETLRKWVRRVERGAGDIQGEGQRRGVVVALAKPGSPEIWLYTGTGATGLEPATSGVTEGDHTSGTRVFGASERRKRRNRETFWAKRYSERYSKAALLQRYSAAVS